jgi:hypothetical protein
VAQELLLAQAVLLLQVVDAPLALHLHLEALTRVFADTAEPAVLGAPGVIQREQGELLCVFLLLSDRGTSGDFSRQEDEQVHLDDRTLDLVVVLRWTEATRAVGEEGTNIAHGTERGSGSSGREGGRKGEMAGRRGRRAVERERGGQWRCR